MTSHSKGMFFVGATVFMCLFVMGSVYALDYRYAADQNIGLWSLNGTDKFSYHYNTQQWFDYSSHDGWVALGSAGSSPANQSLGGNDPNFIGDHQWHDLGNGYQYLYGTNDYGHWMKSSANRWQFAYNYTQGQWLQFGKADNTPSVLGDSGSYSGFIGDGAYHQLWSDGAKYKYIASNDYGYWSSSGVRGADDFRFGYSTGQWYRYYDGSTVYDNVEYKGNRQYLLTDYIYWTSAGLKSSTYTGSSYGTDVQNTLWYDEGNYALANWYNFTPGTDLKWSGGALDVVVMNNSSDSLWMRSWEQYTKEDVLTIEYDLEAGVSLSTVLQGLGYLTSVYGKTIDDLNVVCHGNYTGFYFGNWISTSNYTSFSSQWTQLNNLMTNGGQIQLSHCETGYAASMLNDIAARTNTRIFANINSGWTSMWALNWNYDWDDPNVWNYNYNNVFWGANARSNWSTDYTRPEVDFVDYDFEYQSDGSGNRGYKMLYAFYNPGYSQTDMVYWWNNGYGIR